MKTEKNKKILLEQFKKTPVIQVASERIGINRATYYRWRKKDKEFAKNADKALENGTLLINDMAESQLISAIRDKNLTAIIYWLKHHHSAYANKLEVSRNLTHSYKLSPEQEKNIKKALEMADLTIGKELTDGREK